MILICTKIIVILMSLKTALIVLTMVDRSIGHILGLYRSNPFRKNSITADCSTCRCHLNASGS